jgi:dephospho-CoA kinase
MARDGITEQYARLRISAQKPDEYYRSKCDVELSNGTEIPEAFRDEARVFFQRLIESIREEQRQGIK